MSNLAKLLAAQKATREKGINENAVPETDEAVRNEIPEGESARPNVDKDTSESVAAETSPNEGSGGSSRSGLALLKRANVGASQPAKPAGGLNGILGKGTQRGNESAPRDTGAATAESSGDGPAEFSLDDIAGLDESATPALTPRTGSTSSGFDDEIEATAPDRELPAELTHQQLVFVESLDNIYQVLNDPEMFGQSVRIIMMELQENPEYIKLVSDQDVHVMIRAMRNTMGLARIKKQSRTRKATESSRAKKSSVKDSDMELLASVLGGFGDDE